LGALHGLNPGMGWLFAVALGLQERDRRAVWGALLPMAAGHAAAIGAAVAVAAVIGLAIPMETLRWGVAATLLGFGVARLARHRHPRWAAMRVSRRDLALWSFLMASAHGAGLMALPLVLRASAGAGPVGHHHLALASALPATVDVGLLATLVHTAGYLAVTLLLAVVVYERLGLRVLRTAWVNLDLVWGVALIGTAVLTAVG
ncbi:MAG: hypothetical protein ACREOQ_08610, partial [Gemmatimonadales bacterium]